MPDEPDELSEPLRDVRLHDQRTEIELRLFATTPRAGHRVYLSLEGVRGTADATVLVVSMSGRRPESLALYGLRRASHVGGLAFMIDVTDAVSAATGTLCVSFGLRHELPADAPVAIDRIALVDRV